MKLRSIALAGLLGGALLMMSGCSKDDVIDAVNDALKANVIHVANANSGTAFYVDGEDKQVSEDSSRMFIVKGKNSYTVSDGVNNIEKNFPKDSAHLYALCENDTVLTDTATDGGREIEILNLSGATLSGGNVTVTLYNDSGTAIATKALNKALDACQREVLDLTGFDLKDVETVEINDVNYTIPNYNSDVTAVLDSLNDVDFDIIVFDEATPSGTIVPLATAAELGKASN